MINSPSFVKYYICSYDRSTLRQEGFFCSLVFVFKNGKKQG